jgi:hypothetical protein
VGTRVKGCRAMWLITRLHLVLRFRMHGTVPPLPPCAFLVCCLMIECRDNFTFMFYQLLETSMLPSLGLMW